MEAIPIPLTTAPETDEKRPCIRIKARIKIQGEQQSLTPTIEATRSYQAYCETVTSSRSQTPDIFTTPPTHSQPFQPTQLPHKPTYTARITTRKATTSSASPRSYRNPRLQHVALPDTSSGSSSEPDIVAHRVLSQGSLTVQQARTPCSDPANGAADRMSRNRTLSLSQVQPANIVAEATQHHTPLKQKRYGRMHMEYQPMPTLPPSPPESPTIMLEEKPLPSKTTVNFSRGEISPKPLQIQKEVKASHRACGKVFTPTPELTSSAQDMNTIFVRAEEERPRSKASKRTVTFADDTTISSRSSSPIHHTNDHEQILRQSRSFTAEAQIPSSLRLYRSHDSLLAASPLAHEQQGTNATRRTAPKDFKHRYPFGERPASRIAPPPSLGRVSNANYNPRLSTSKAQYRGLASLPRPLPSSLRIAQPQTGPRQPPWGSLGDLEEQREKRVDARERDQAKQFRAATLSEATTLASADSFGKDRMKKEVEEYREQVMSMYPDMAFDGNAGKGGRGCCCAVM